MCSHVGAILYNAILAAVNKPVTLCRSCRTQTILLTTSGRFRPIRGPDLSPGLPWQRVSKSVFRPEKTNRVEGDQKSEVTIYYHLVSQKRKYILDIFFNISHSTNTSIPRHLPYCSQDIHSNIYRILMPYSNKIISKFLSPSLTQ